MKSALFWDFTQYWLVVSNRHFGTTYRSHLQDLWRFPAGGRHVQEFLNIFAHQLTGYELQQPTALMKRILTTDKRRRRWHCCGESSIDKQWFEDRPPYGGWLSYLFEVDHLIERYLKIEHEIEAVVESYRIRICRRHLTWRSPSALSLLFSPSPCALPTSNTRQLSVRNTDVVPLNTSTSIFAFINSSCAYYHVMYVPGSHNPVFPIRSSLCAARFYLLQDRQESTPMNLEGYLYSAHCVFRSRVDFADVYVIVSGLVLYRYS